jgi:hypothetical protein
MHVAAADGQDERSVSNRAWRIVQRDVASRMGQKSCSIDAGLIQSQTASCPRIAGDAIKIGEVRKSMMRIFDQYRGAPIVVVGFDRHRRLAKRSC